MTELSLFSGAGGGLLATGPLNTGRVVMHHSGELPDELRKELDGLFQASSNDEQITKLKFGATGRFPGGSLHEFDEGEIQFGVACDEKRGLVHIDFGDKPIVHMAANRQQAMDLGRSLIRHARKLRGR